MAEDQFRDRISLLLSNLEQGREVRTYLQNFSRAEGGCFAVIKIGGALVQKDQDALARRLALLQGLGLKPIVVFGAGPQLDKRLEAECFGKERRDGLRITPADALRIVAEETSATGYGLVHAIAAAGGRAVMAPPSMVVARMIDEEKYGRVGEAEGVHEEGLDLLLDGESIPLVSCVAQDRSGRLLNVNADAVAREVAKAVRPLKVVFLTSTGGLLDENDQVIDSINLTTDYDRLMAEDWVHGGMAVKLEQIKLLLSELPPSSSVSMTDTRAMLKELFTHGGAGTLIRQGERVLTADSVDAGKLTPLIEGAFGRELRGDYWDTLDLDYVVYTERYRAAAVMTKIDGVACLDKFAVSPEARGEGLAKTVWRVMRERSPSLFWRSRPTNPFNGFYMAAADGFIRRGPWLVFWCGEDLSGRIFALADALGSRPADFTTDHRDD